jgi:hypothetical protein
VNVGELPDTIDGILVATINAASVDDKPCASNDTLPSSTGAGDFMTSATENSAAIPTATSVAITINTDES